MICAFCGHEDIDPKSKEEAGALMVEHIAGCDKHPLRTAVVLFQRLEADITTLKARMTALEGGRVACD